MEKERRYPVTSLHGQIAFHNIVRTTHESSSHEQKKESHSCVYLVLSAKRPKKRASIRIKFYTETVERSY